MNEELDWEEASKHFHCVFESYQALVGKPGVNVSFAISLVFQPLQYRYETGERTPELHKAMMEVE